MRDVLESIKERIREKGLPSARSVLMLFIGALVLVACFGNQIGVVLNQEILVLISMLIFLVLWGSIGELSIGKVLTLKSRNKEISKDLDEQRKDNETLRNQISAIVSATFKNTQTVTVQNGQYREPALTKGEQDESDDDASCHVDSGDQSIENDAGAISEISSTDSGSANAVNASFDGREQRAKIRAAMPLVAKYAIAHFGERVGIAPTSFIPRMRLSDNLEGLDPISNYHMTFDAYARGDSREYFVEVLHVQSRTVVNSINIYRLYVQLARVKLYGNVNNTDATLALIVVQYPQSDQGGKKDCVEKLQQLFYQAINNRLLEIVPIRLDEEKLNTMVEECEGEI